MSLSLVTGWLPVVASCVAALALALSLDWRNGGWRRQLGVGVPVGAGLAGLVALARWLGAGWSEVTGSVLVWASVVGLAACCLAIGWRRVLRWRRALAVGAVVLAVAVTLGAVNQQSDSFPTVGRLVTADPVNVVDTPQLLEMRKRVAATGRLPDQGVVFTVTIPPVVSHFPTRPAFVYVPPAWFAATTPPLPTLVLLPGEPGSAADWSGDGKADNTADAFAEAHHGVAPIIVMPDPNGLRTIDTECVNSRFGNAETYLTVDVPDFARSRLGASRAPGALAVAGLSAGGTCSLMLALRHPTLYPTFASFSGFASPQYEETTLAQTIDTLFGGSEDRFAAHDPIQLLRDGRFTGVAGWFEVGVQDVEPLEATRNLEPAARRAGVAVCTVVKAGGHDFQLWSQALADAFPWLSWRLGVGPEPAHLPGGCG